MLQKDKDDSVASVEEKQIDIENLLEQKDKNDSVEIIDSGLFRKPLKKRTTPVEKRPSKRARILPEVLKASEILISPVRGDTKGTYRRNLKKVDVCGFPPDLSIAPSSYNLDSFKKWLKRGLLRKFAMRFVFCIHICNVIMLQYLVIVR